jgi:hypothetical protein
MPMGVVVKSASTDEYVWVAKAGVVLALPESGVTATMGYIAYTSSSEAGRLAQASGIGTAQHWRESGHWKKTGTGNGALTLFNIHFN